MRKLFLIITILILSITGAYSQTKGYLSYDSVYIQKAGGNSELILLNRTRDSLGFLYNKGNGRTEFRKEADPSVPSYVKSILSTQISRWDSAHSWGNHTGLYKSLSYIPTWAEITGKPVFNFQNALIAGSTLTQDNTIGGGGKSLFINNLLEFGVYKAGGAFFEITASGLSFGGSATFQNSVTLSSLANGGATRMVTIDGQGILGAAAIPSGTGGGITTETDPTVGSHIKAITTTNISNWNTAFSWGNHSGLYKLSSYVPAWTEITGKPSFHLVATSGSYTDLINKPTIPTGIPIGGLQNQVLTKTSNTDYAVQWATPVVNSLQAIVNISDTIRRQNNQNVITGRNNQFGDYLSGGIVNYSDGWGFRSVQPNGNPSRETIYRNAKIESIYAGQSYSLTLPEQVTDTVAHRAWVRSLLSSGITSETDPTVGSHIKAITTTNISNWNTSYGWGDHSTQGYLKSVTDANLSSNVALLNRNPQSFSGINNFNNTVNITRSTTTTNDPQLIVWGASNMKLHVGTYANAGATIKYGFIQSSENGVSNDRILALNPFAGNIYIGGNTFAGSRSPSKVNIWGNTYIGDYNAPAFLDLEGSIRFRILDGLIAGIKENHTDGANGGITLQRTVAGVLTDGLILDKDGLVTIGGGLNVGNHLRLSYNTYFRNKANTNWNNFLIRNDAGTETVLDMYGVGTANIQNAVISGLSGTGTGLVTALADGTIGRMAMVRTDVQNDARFHPLENQRVGIGTSPSFLNLTATYGITFNAATSTTQWLQYALPDNNLYVRDITAGQMIVTYSPYATNRIDFTRKLYAQAAEFNGDVLSSISFSLPNNGKLKWGSGTTNIHGDGTLNRLYFYTNNIERGRVVESGNWLFGTDIEVANGGKVQVSGDLRATGGIFTGLSGTGTRSLYVDANGQLTTTGAGTNPFNIGSTTLSYNGIGFHITNSTNTPIWIGENITKVLINGSVFNEATGNVTLGGNTGGVQILKLASPSGKKYHLAIDDQGWLVTDSTAGTGGLDPNTSFTFFRGNTLTGTGDSLNKLDVDSVWAIGLIQRHAGGGSGTSDVSGWPVFVGHSGEQARANRVFTPLPVSISDIDSDNGLSGGTYTIPEDGVYELYGKVSVKDGFLQQVSIGVGVGIVSGGTISSGESMMWGIGFPNRNGINTSRIMTLTAGQTVGVTTYLDTNDASTPIGNTYFTVKRIR